MAEEQKEQPQVPQIDMKAISEQVGQAVRAAIGDIAKQTPAPQPQPVPQPKSDPIADAVLPSLIPILKPIADNLDLQARASYDATLFYTTNADAHKYMGEIEKMFAERPRPRKDIWNEYRGAHLDDFYKAKLAEDQEAQRRAALALTVGSGAPRGFAEGLAKDPFEMTDEELQQSVQNAQF